MVSSMMEKMTLLETQNMLILNMLNDEKPFPKVIELLSGRKTLLEIFQKYSVLDLPLDVQNNICEDNEKRMDASHRNVREKGNLER